MTTALSLSVGCGEPISNAWFYSGDELSSALPSTDRLTPPLAFLAETVPDDLVFASGRDIALLAHSALLVPASAGDALRSTPPESISEERRTWEPMLIAFSSGFGVSSLWIRGEVLAPANDDLRWTLEGASTEQGPWAPLGEGWHEPTEGAGAMSWSAGEASALLQDGPSGTLSIEYTDEPREVVLSWSAALDDDLVYRDESDLEWSDQISVTDDGSAWPATTSGWAVVEIGGAAEGVISTDITDLAFVQCWNDAGQTVYRDGDDGITPVGDEQACPSPPIPAP